MSAVALDTSVLLRLLTGLPEAQAHVALSELTRCLRSGATVIVTDLVLAEAYFALQHHYGVPKTEALRLLGLFMAESGATCTGAASAVLATPGLATAKPGFVDRLIHAECLQAADELLTFETAAARLPGVRVLKGVSPGGL